MMADHSHDAREVGAAYERHDHDVRDVLHAAEEHHSHTARDLGGVPTLQQYDRLADRVADLEMQLEALQARFEAERQVSTAVTDGQDTAERIAAAIERRADLLMGFDQHRYLVTQLRALADEIRRGVS